VPHVEPVADAAAFLDLTVPLRAREPVLTNVIGTVAAGIVHGRTYDRCFWWLVRDDAGDVVGCAMRTAPWKLLVSPMPASAASALGSAVAVADPRLPGTVGPQDVVDAVVRGMAEAGRAVSTSLDMVDVVHVLETYRPPAGVPGRARRAVDAELDLLVEWEWAFADEAGVPRPEVQGVQARLRTGGMFWWEVDGERVALAGHQGPVPTPGGVVGRIGPVYTPPEHRRHGYGATVTAAVVEQLLPQCTTVMLFADAANPTSNGVYERLGFREVARVVDVSFTKNEPEVVGSDRRTLLDADRAHVWHPYGSATDPLPVLPVASASGVRLRLTDGRELVDGMSSWWAAVHGYRHPALDAAVRTQLDRMAHVMLGGLTHEPAVRLAERLVEITPEGLTRVFFTDSGSVAVEVALKMAVQYAVAGGRPGRTRLLTVRGGYHGDTLWAMSVCDPDTGMHRTFPGLPEQLFAERPACRFDEPLEPRHTADIERLLAAHADEVAAVVLEPVVQGAGGMWFYAPAYLRRVRELCDAHGVLLVLDEIATGFGRSGRLFAAEHAGIEPDLMCVGKALTGGYLSMGATLCTEEVARVVSSGPNGALMHGPTFMGNPLAAAVSLASVDLLLERGWAADVDRIAAALSTGLAPARDLPGVTDVRVLGAIGVVETRDPVNLRVVTPLLVERGVWLRPFGRLVYTMPPYVTGDDDLDRITSALVEVVAQVAR
jgi:adenosylmethionine-8-amino-7-oxononanoate aminotransferase